MTKFERKLKELEEQNKPDQMWFDVEKSQKRYEELLDKHKQVQLNANRDHQREGSAHEGV